MRRVVVTGLGIICPVGNNLTTAWNKILAGSSGVRLITDLDLAQHATKFAGTIVDFNPEQYIASKELKKCDPFMQYGIAAGIQAMQDAGFAANEPLTNLDLNKAGVLIGSGIGGITQIEANSQILCTQGPRRISPFFIPASLINMIAGHLSIMYGLRGPNLALATACASGTHAIGLAARMIKYGDADLMLAGGAEKASTALCLAGFNAMKALSTRNTDPQAASRPWDVDRDGFVLSDGAGVVVLEEYTKAKQRGARIYAELKGFGMSADAYHITKPPAGAVGAETAMRFALQDAQIDPAEVGYINAHATSTMVGDLEESIAIEKVFNNAKSNIQVSSTKSMTGHLLGATGAIEAIFTILALRDQVIPPTINLQQVAPDCKLDYVPNFARKVNNLRVGMSNSFGFGGTNGTLVFKTL